MQITFPIFSGLCPYCFRKATIKGLCVKHFVCGEPKRPITYIEKSLGNH
jgi:hypothetical protein